MERDWIDTYVEAMRVALMRIDNAGQFVDACARDRIVKERAIRRMETGT